MAPARHLILPLIVSLSPILGGCAHTPLSQGWEAGQYLRVSFPDMKLAKDEYIESVEVEVQDGVIATINWVPPDWDLDLAWDNPVQTFLDFHARHFSAGFAAARDLDGFITVQAGHPSRFEMRIVLVTEAANPAAASPPRTNVLTRSELILAPVPRPPNLSPRHTMPAELLEEIKPTPPLVAAPGEYTVHSGDRLASIARMYGLSLPELLALNPGLENRTLPVGLRIRVKAR